MMTDKKKTRLKWIAIFTCVAIVTVSVTLAVCFSNQKKKGTRDKYFYYFNSSCIATPYGDIFAMEEDNSFSRTSVDQSTMIYGWSDKTFSVISQYGLRHVGKKVNRLTRSAIFLSHNGKSVYFVDNEEFNSGTNTLWFYNVKADTCTKISTIEYEVEDGMISPKGNYVVLLEKRNDLVTIHLYNKGQKVKSYEAGQVVQLYFVTDAGVVFYNDENYGLKSLGRNADEEVLLLTEDEMVESAWINKDCTELILNCGEGCYFYRLKNNGKVAQKVKLLEEGGLAAYAYDSIYSDGEVVVLNIDSFCDVNLRNTSTQHRCKLTKNGKLIVQEGSDTMYATLAVGDAFLYYEDEKGDYFYTNTDDENGEYHLLLEASACKILPGDEVMVTANKSVYYWDVERNLHYANRGRDKVLLPTEDTSNLRAYTIDPFTDVIYWATEEAVYCSAQGKTAQKMFDIEDVFSEEQPQIRLVSAGYDQVYCHTTGEDIVVQLFSNGRYHVMKLAE